MAVIRKNVIFNLDQSSAFVLLYNHMGKKPGCTLLTVIYSQLDPPPPSWPHLLIVCIKFLICLHVYRPFGIHFHSSRCAVHMLHHPPPNFLCQCSNSLPNTPLPHFYWQPAKLLLDLRFVFAVFYQYVLWLLIFPDRWNHSPSITFWLISLKSSP